MLVSQVELRRVYAHGRSLVPMVKTRDFGMTPGAKARPILEDLAARLKSRSSQNLFEAKFFSSLLGLKHTKRGCGSTTGLGGRRKLGGALAEVREGVQRKTPLLAKNARNGAPRLRTQPPHPASAPASSPRLCSAQSSAGLCRAGTHRDPAGIGDRLSPLTAASPFGSIIGTSSLFDFGRGADLNFMQSG